MLHKSVPWKCQFVPIGLERLDICSEVVFIEVKYRDCIARVVRKIPRNTRGCYFVRLVYLFATARECVNEDSNRRRTGGHWNIRATYLA